MAEVEFFWNYTRLSAEEFLQIQKNGFKDIYLLVTWYLTNHFVMAFALLL